VIPAYKASKAIQELRVWVATLATKVIRVWVATPVLLALLGRPEQKGTPEYRVSRVIPA
jgi:hypothetical protein